MQLVVIGSSKRVSFDPVFKLENGNEKLKIIMKEGAVVSYLNLAKCFLRPLVGSLPFCWGSLHAGH